MPMPAGTFIWYDLMTGDTAAAEAFYKSVIGWDAKHFGGPMDYTLLSMAGHDVGGLMPLSAEVKAMGVPPCWTGYIGVPDVDAYTKRVVEAGGAVHREPSDIPGVGRFSVVADPYGATFIMMKGSSTEVPAPVAPNTAGHIGWHELHVSDSEGAFAFYHKLFGWTKTEAMEMGPMGTYQMFSTGGPTVGGMMNKMAEMPVSCWLYYFNVESIDAAIAKVTAGGGKLLTGPREVPGPAWIANCLDPQGAMFAMVAPKR